MSNRQLSAKPPSAPAIRQAAMSRQAATQLARKAAEDFLAAGSHYVLRGHKIDNHAKAVLKRVSGPGRQSDKITAAEIIAALPPKKQSALLADCIIAEHRARSHSGWQKAQVATLERHPGAVAALKTVRAFLGRSEPDTQESEALHVLQVAISQRHRLAADHVRIYSRKTTAEAGRAEGVAWIKGALSKLCGGASPQNVAALATAALDMGDVTAEAARKARPIADRLTAMRDNAARSSQKK